jgi:hypothetical protein
VALSSTVPTNHICRDGWPTVSANPPFIAPGQTIAADSLEPALEIIRGVVAYKWLMRGGEATALPAEVDGVPGPPTRSMSTRSVTARDVFFTHVRQIWTSTWGLVRPALCSFVFLYTSLCFDLMLIGTYFCFIFCTAYLWWEGGVWKKILCTRSVENPPCNTVLLHPPVPDLAWWSAILRWKIERQRLNHAGGMQPCVTVINVKIRRYNPVLHEGFSASRMLRIFRRGVCQYLTLIKRNR